MGYITLILSEAALIEGGMLVDQGTEQTRDREDMMPVTLHEEDLRRGTFVIAQRVNGHFLPFTWKADGHPHQAVVGIDGVYLGGTLQQFLHRQAQQAGSALRHGWAPRVAQHLPRED